GYWWRVLPWGKGRAVPGLDRSRSLGRGEHLGGLLLDRRALEEVGVDLAPEAHGVAEHEVAEILLVDQPVLDQLVGFGDDVGHVRHVEMSDVRAEDRVE